jgi:acyl-CoA synthetase (AMP-forming)/AMP-acid ligase II
MLIDGTPLDSPAVALDDLLRVGLEMPDDLALVSANRSLSWGALEAESNRLAVGYRGLGLEPGDRVASLMPNRIDLVVHYLACFRAGLIITPLNYRYTFREVDHALEVSGAKALVAHVERAEEVEGALGEHPAVELAGVVGVHDTVHGENVRAYLTLRDGAERPSSADLIVFCRERIGYKAPEEVVFLDEMPLNPTGKIDRVGLKRMAEDHLHPHGLD